MAWLWVFLRIHLESEYVFTIKHQKFIPSWKRTKLEHLCNISAEMLTITSWRVVTAALNNLLHFLMKQSVMWMVCEILFPRLHFSFLLTCFNKIYQIQILAKVTDLTGHWNKHVCSQKWLDDVQSSITNQSLHFISFFLGEVKNSLAFLCFAVFRMNEYCPKCFCAHHWFHCEIGWQLWRTHST